MRFVVTTHAAERWCLRICDSGTTGARRAILHAAQDAVRVPTQRGASHHQWRVDTHIADPPHAILVTLETAPGVHTVVTVLGPGEVYTPTRRPALPSADDERRAPVPPQRTPRKRHWKRKVRTPQGQPDVADVIAAEMAQAAMEREEDANASQDEVVAPKAVVAAPQMVVAPAIATADRGAAMAEYHRLAREARALAEMALEGGHSVTLADVERATAQLAEYLPVLLAAFPGKVATERQARGTLETAQNRVGTLRAQIAAKERIARCANCEAEVEDVYYFDGKGYVCDACHDGLTAAVAA